MVRWVLEIISMFLKFLKLTLWPSMLTLMGVGLKRKLKAKELMLLNCGVGEDSWESLGLQGDPTTPS